LEQGAGDKADRVWWKDSPCPVKLPPPITFIGVEMRSRAYHLDPQPRMDFVAEGKGLAPAKAATDLKSL